MFSWEDEEFILAIRSKISIFAQNKKIISDLSVIDVSNFEEVKCVRRGTSSTFLLELNA